MSNSIPKIFFDQALQLGLNASQAVELYTAIHNKKNTSELIQRWGTTKARHTDFNKALAILKGTYKALRQSSSNQYEAVPQQTLVASALASLERSIGPFGSKKVLPLKSEQPVRAVVISDLHVPFCDPEALARVLSEDAEVLYINGDFFDMYSASRHPKLMTQITVHEELAAGVAIMERLSKKFDAIYAINGNHDLRSRKALQSTMPELLPLLVSPMELMAAKFKNLILQEHVVPNTNPEIALGELFNFKNLFVKNNACHSHLDNFCGPLAAEQGLEWLRKWSTHLGITQPIDVFYQAHTHRLGLTYSSDGSVMVLSGCLCKNMPYIYEQHGKYTPPVRGYVTHLEVNGRVKPDTIQLVKI